MTAIMISRIIRLIPCIILPLSGCAVGPDFEIPAAPEIESYTAAEMPLTSVETKGHGGGAQHFVKGGSIPADWWRLFHSKKLNDLIEKGIKNNNNLKAAQAALRQAEANYWVAIGPLFPAVTGGGNGSRQRVNGASLDETSLQPVTFNLFNVGFNLSYTLDVFGGIRRQVEAAGAQVDFQDFEEKAAFLTLTSNIVTTAIMEASLRAQIDATQQLVFFQEKNYEISKKSFDLGGKSKIDTLAQEAQLYQTKGLIAPLQNSLAQQRTTLAVLVGELPSASTITPFDLDEITLPTEMPMGIPSCLVHGRPDVRAAEALLHAASAQIGVATANLLPQFTITGNYGGTSNFIKDLFKHSANVWTLMGGVLQPIFEGGALIAKQDAAIAAFEQAFAQYRETVLEAYKNVADALQALELDAVQLQVLTEAERAATESLKLTQVQYDLGAVSYLNLIIAQRQYLQSRISRIQALASRYTNTAALFQALGGGWWNEKGQLSPCALKEQKGSENVL